MISGCGTAASDSCPGLVTYDQAATNKAQTELDALPKDAELRIMISDYLGTRDVIRACQKAGR